MKKNISILFAALIILGCTKEEPKVLETSNKIEVSSSTDMLPIKIILNKSSDTWNTKASIVKNFEINDAVTVSAFQDDVTCFTDAVKKTNEGWSMNGHYYWQSYNAEYDGEKYLDFCFVYPQRTINDKSFIYELSPNPSEQEDLLVKHIRTQAPEDYSAVNVQMNHALSLIEFKAKAEEGGFQYKIESIALNNDDIFYDKGTYTFGSGWNNKEKVNGITTIQSPINNPNITSTNYTNINNGDYCFILPQDISTLGINVIYSVIKNGNKYTDTKSTLINERFVEGIKYTYNINLPAISSESIIKVCDGVNGDAWYVDISNLRDIIKNIPSVPFTIRVIYYYTNMAIDPGSNGIIRIKYQDVNWKDGILKEYYVVKDKNLKEQDIALDIPITNEGVKWTLENCQRIVYDLGHHVNIRRIEVVY